MTNESGLREKIRAVLSGIDATETEHPEGWWETSNGAAFGAQKLAELLALISPAGEVGGWRLVPEKPTEAMLKAGWFHLCERPITALQAYDAMLSAAPRGMEG